MRSSYLITQNQKVKEEGRECSCFTSFDMFITIGLACLICSMTAFLSDFETTDFVLLFAGLTPKLISENEFDGHSERHLESNIPSLNTLKKKILLTLSFTACYLGISNACPIALTMSDCCAFTLFIKCVITHTRFATETYVCIVTC
jgi:hypothetical protein